MTDLGWTEDDLRVATCQDRS
ncbi:hypothetical protein RB213_010304 [Colletotrichum asianum]